MRTRPAVVAAGLAVLLSSVLPACGASDDGDGSATEGGPSTESSPFEVVDPPAGYELAEVRLGTTEPILYSDALATQEPYTLLSADGSLDGEVVGVSYFVIWDSNPTNTRPGLRPDEDHDDYAIGDGWSDLEVHGAMMSIRVSSSAERSAEELQALADEVPLPVPGDGNQMQPAPRIPDGLDGFEEVGRVESPVLVALEAPAAPDAYRSTDPVGSHAQRWVSDDGPDVAVRTLPGVSADLEMLGEHPWMSPRLQGESTVRGRPARSLRYCIAHLHDGEQCSAALVTTSAGGDLVVVSSEEDVDTEVLERFAAGVDTVDVDRWDELARDAWGGPNRAPISAVPRWPGAPLATWHGSRSPEVTPTRSSGRSSTSISA